MAGAMTLSPLVDPSIRGIKGKPAEVKGECAAPGCSSPAQQRHHLWPRSFLRGQPTEWISVCGVTMQNTIGLCVPCHLAVTGDIGGHRAHIRYDQAKGVFEWWAKGAGDDWFYVGLLKRKGLVDGQPQAKRIRRSEGLCPECGQQVREPHLHEPGPRRKVSTWSVVVPDDAEVGSELLDEWVEQFAVFLGFGEASARLKRYHVLSLLFPWVMMNKESFLEDLEEAEFFAR